MLNCTFSTEVRSCVWKQMGKKSCLIQGRVPCGLGSAALFHRSFRADAATDDAPFTRAALPSGGHAPNTQPEAAPPAVRQQHESGHGPLPARARSPRVRWGRRACPRPASHPPARGRVLRADGGSAAGLPLLAAGGNARGGGRGASPARPGPRRWRFAGSSASEAPAAVARLPVRLYRWEPEPARAPSATAAASSPLSPLLPFHLFFGRWAPPALPTVKSGRPPAIAAAPHGDPGVPQRLREGQSRHPVSTAAGPDGRGGTGTPHPTPPYPTLAGGTAPRSRGSLRWRAARKVCGAAAAVPAHLPAEVPPPTSPRAGAGRRRWQLRFPFPRWLPSPGPQQHAALPRCQPPAAVRHQPAAAAAEVPGGGRGYERGLEVVPLRGGPHQRVRGAHLHWEADPPHHRLLRLPALGRQLQTWVRGGLLGAGRAPGLYRGSPRPGGDWWARVRGAGRFAPGSNSPHGSALTLRRILCPWCVSP